jgi:MFS family permease
MRFMSDATGDAAAQARAFRLFLFCASLWFAGFGQQQVLIPYLITVTLHESAENVGLAQMALQLPSLFLAFPAGAMADRYDPRRQLVIATALAALPPLVFAVAIQAGFLTYAALIAFGLVMGAASAFTMTARDTLLGMVADPHKMQGAIGAFTIATFGSQLIGMALAAFANTIGPAPLFVIQALFVLASVGLLTLLPKLPARAPVTTGRRAHLVEGLAFAARTPAIRTVLVAMSCVGLFYFAAFIVLIPLQIRDIHHGDAGTFALMNICFWSGSITTNLILMRVPVLRRGRAMLLALSWGALVLALMSLPLPLWAFLGLCVAWGFGSGVTLNMGRTIVQENTPAAFRGRVLALFQLGFIGGAPLGALVLGFVAADLGPLRAMLVPALGAAALIASLALFTDLRKVTRRAPATVAAG